MNASSEQVRYIQLSAMKVEIHPSREAMGAAAAAATAEALQELAQAHETVAAIFATGASQLDTLDALTSIPGLPWAQICGFHLDEYVGLPLAHKASFRGYLREKLTQKVKIKEFHEIDGTAPDPGEVCASYAALLHASQPQLCLLGIGENGHLAFNDPGVADFNDPLDVKVVNLDNACRQQQAAEGWFTSPAEVPNQAISLTIPTILRVPRLIVSVPGERKARVVRRALEEAISTECPATILRTHPGVTLYLDPDSAAQLAGLIPEL